MGHPQRLSEIDKQGKCCEAENCTDIPNEKRSFYALYVKRMIDVILCTLACIILLPLFIVIAVLELFFHGRPITYKTRRPGKNGRIITMRKFRSMTNERDANGQLLPEEKRLTRFGRFLRKTSIDELPELLSIIKGDMAIIGPRPLLVEYNELYTSRHAARLKVRPGLACVRIMKSTSTTWTWREQFENDIYYIENISFLTDVKMVLAVIREVIRGSSYRTDDTRAPFTGDNLDDTRSKNEIENVVRYDSVSK